MDMRGLSHFIRDVRKATGNRQEEEDRVDEELAKIRAKFIDTGHISTYERKKYVCKLMFISMLGYPIVFGHMESIQLMAEDTPAEKLIGYLAAAILLNESSELLKLTTHTVYRDLMSGSNLNRSLALTAVANTGGRTFAETMNRGIEGILLDDNADIHIRKKALLTQLHIYRTYPHIVDLTKVVPKAAELLGASQAGVTMCAVTFLNGCITKDTEYLYKGVPGKLIEILACIIVERKTDPGYMYYGVPAPWLQSKVLRFLQYFPIPKDAHLRERIVGILRKMIKATDKVLKDAQTQQKQRGTQNRVSAMNSVLIEVVSLLIKWDVGADVIMDCANVIRGFITDKRESNLRYIGLTLLSRLSFVRNPDFDFQLLGRQYQQQIIVSLHDPDMSIRRKSLGMLVAMCNEVNADNIIKKLQSYLPIAVKPEFQLSLVQSIASLTAKYCDDINTHVDVMLSIIAQAGDLCSQEIAYRAVRLITNNPQVQKRAANMVFRTLRSKKHVPQMMVGVAAFLLGEFGYQIALNAESTPHFQFNLLNGQLDFASEETQSMILATFFKFYSLYDDARVREQIMHTLKRYKSSLDPELQQRASEYVMLLETGSREILEKVLEPMPAFPNDTDSSVEEVKHPSDIHGVSVSNIETSGSGAKRQPSLAASSAPEAVAAQLGDFSSLSAPAHPRQAAVRDDQLHDLFTYAPRDSIGLRQVHEQSRLRFTSLLLNTEGVLFADDQVEVHVAMTFHQADCRMIVEVRPRQQEAGLASADAEIVGTDGGLLLQARCLSTKGPIPPGQCLVVEIAGRSLAAFSSPPSIRLAYAIDSKRPEVVRIVSLPIVSARFITPYGTGSSRVDQLYDSVQRTTSPVVRAIAAPKDPSKEAVQKTLHRLGCSSFVNGEGNVVAVGAHTTQPRGKLMYRPVACEVAWTGTGMLVTVYTSETSLQMDILNMLEVVL